MIIWHQDYGVSSHILALYATVMWREAHQSDAEYKQM